MAYEFRCERRPDGVLLHLVQKKRIGADQTISYENWSEVLSNRYLRTLAWITRALDEEETENGAIASILDGGVFLSNCAIANIPESDAAFLNLPPPTKLALNIQANGHMAQPDFSLASEWIRAGGLPAFGVVRDGALLEFEDELYRIPNPLYEIAEAVEQFRKEDCRDSDKRMAALARLKIHVNDAAPGMLDQGPYLRNLRLHHASAFSLSLSSRNAEFQFDPVLFSSTARARIEREGRVLDEAESLLPPVQQELFAKRRFTNWSEARACYPIDNNTFVFIDPNLRDALTVARKAQSADRETRKAFARNPQKFIREQLGDTEDDAFLDTLFVETQQYSERVVDIGLWQPEVLPWLKREPNTWLPEKFGIVVNGERLEIPPEDVEPFKEAVKAAIKEGRTTASLKGIEVPASEATLNALSSLIGLSRPEGDGSDEDVDGASPDTPPLGFEEEQAPYEVSGQRYFAIVRESFEDIDFVKQLKPRLRNPEFRPPTNLRSSLEPHQVQGFEWLARHWASGTPGVLLCDDMGLGKTFQTLTFLAWLQVRRRQLAQATRAPILIVAPTGLLANWQEEIDKHLLEPGLGEIARAYGRELRNFRISGANGRDIELGASTLDINELRRFDVILTTYETFRDYHLSFMTLPFSAAVLDEVQKAKNPTSQISKALKSINTDFFVALTGTPIENRLEDLWSITDIVFPGFLLDLRSFSSKYKPDQPDELRNLHIQMCEPSDAMPAPMLRRMKSDHLEGLPEKRANRVERPMPEVQAKAYRQAVDEARGESSPPILETLHRLRGISLHPHDPATVDPGDIETYVAASARLSATFEILDDIQRRGEKALIFLESRDMQALLAVLLKRKYGLDHEPLRINGSIPGEKRQKFVNEFQSDDRKGQFDIMILGPKAGGVGLTLTAANHVIHLSRWWNPAVEDQCTDRIYRMGQIREVTVHYPMATHPDPDIHGFSFDLKLDALLERKRQLSRDMLLPPEMADDASSLYADAVGRRSSSKGSTQADAEEFDRMEPLAFETWLMNRAKAVGYEVVRTPPVGDAGADMILTHRKSGAKIIVQAKHTLGKACSDEAAIQLLQAREQYGLPNARMVAVTNASRFTATATGRMRRLGIVGISRSGLPSWPHMLV